MLSSGVICDFFFMRLFLASLTLCISRSYNQRKVRLFGVFFFFFLNLKKKICWRLLSPEPQDNLQTS